jgi:hypothetical protein
MTKTTKKRTKITAAQREARRANVIELNRSKPALAHGIHAAIATGEAPDGVLGAAEVAQQVDAIIGEMISDLGGPSELTAQRKAILESQRMCLLVLGLANSFIRREGLLNRKGKPHPLLSTVVSFANTLRLNGVTLGLERKARKVGPSTLDEYLETRETQTPQESDSPKVTQ